MAMRSPYPDVEIPDVALAEFVYADAPARGDAVAIVDGPTGRSYSYAMLHHLVGRCAAGLAERGVQQHDVVGVFAPNIPEWPIVFHGVARLGAINTTINSLYTAQETAFQLKDARAKYLITIPQFLDRALPAAAEAGIAEVFVLGEGEGATPFAGLLASGAPTPAPEIDAAHDLVSLPYSSGTTGLPEGRHAHAPQPGREHAPVRRLPPRHRRGRPRDGRAAVLPHLRPDRRHERLPAPRRADRHDAAVRARGLPRTDPAAPDHDRLRGAADRRRARQAPAGRPVRPLVAAASSCAAPRRSTPGCRTPAPSASAATCSRGTG